MTPIDAFFAIYESWCSLFEPIPYGNPYLAAVTFVILLAFLTKTGASWLKSD